MLTQLLQYDFGHWFINRKSTKPLNTYLSNFDSVNTSAAVWLKPGHPNLFAVKSNSYPNSAGMTHQKWTSTQFVSFAIGSTEPPHHSSPECICIMWYVSPTSIQSFRRQDCRTHLYSTRSCVCGLWSELPPNRQRREVGAAKAAAPAAKSARASSKQRPQLTTPWRREALGARPPPGTNSPTANQRQPAVRKGGTPKQTTPAKPKGKPTKTWPPKGPQEGANENVTTSRDGAHGRNQSKQGSQTKQKNTTATYWYTAVQIDCCTSINQLCTKAMSTLWFVTTQPYREDRNSAGLGTKRGRWTHSQATWSNVPSSVQLSQMQAVEG